jgi:hypothetical protein
MIYQITIEESYKWHVTVEAESREEALDKANELDISSIEPDSTDTVEIWITEP